MKKAFIFFIFSLYVVFLPKLSADTTLPLDEGPIEISLDFKDAELKDLLKVFSIQSGLNFIASEVVEDRKITLYMNKVPLDKAMDKLFEANNLSYELDKASNIFIVKEWGKVVAETITKVFFLKYASVSISPLLNKGDSSTSSTSSESSSDSTSSDEESEGITGAVEGLLSEHGSVIEDYRTNSLIVTDTPKNMERITQVIASLDVSIPQVLLEVEMLDVNKNVVDEMGISWPSSPLGLDINGQKLTRFPFGEKGTSGTGKTLTDTTAGSWNAKHFGPSVLSVLNASFTLDFLRTQTDTKSLARPRILTLNNETAEIKITTSSSVGVTTTTAGTTTETTTQQAERIETGVILTVTPQINVETGEITMFINPKVSAASGGATITVGGNTYTYLDPEERSTKSTVRVKDGETVIIGGLLRTDKLVTRTKVPILGDLPLIGALFRHKGSDNDKNQERELLVFITPHILKEDRIEIAQAKDTIPYREQDIFIEDSRELAIGSALNEVERKKKFK